MTELKKYFIVNFGCQMNVLDAERMEGLLLARGMAAAADVEDADLVLINSCSVREKPERKAISLLGRLCRDKTQKPGMKVGFCGCVAQQHGSKLLERFSGLDFVLGTNQVAALLEVLDRVLSGERPLQTGFADEKDLDCLFNVSANRPVKGVSAFVTIMEGCDNFCAYCVVPYVRGPELSRAPEDIIKEIESLADRGVREVTLLGQNVNSYGLKRGFGTDFPDLLKVVAKVDGIERVRFTTSHPKDLSDKLVETMAGEKKICEQIHLPLQAGSDRVLSLMGRGYTGAQYLALVDKLRSAMPEIGISSDLIAGFPGESEDDFQGTLEMVNRVRFDEAFTFRYSERPSTRASGLPGQLSEEVRLDRLWRLSHLVSEITEQKNQAQVGTRKEILLFEASKNDPEKFTGRSREGRLVHIPKTGSEGLLGGLVTVKISRGLKHSLLGEKFEQEPSRSWQGEEQCLSR
jgi:tRNA-2-methylthio-N6-dimethylallyladenosine synthase